MIYFVQSIEGGPVKIGFTDDLGTRLKALEFSYRCGLAVLATLPGGRDEERSLHERFSHLRFGRTKQFRPAPDLMAFIDRPLLVGVNPDTVEPMEPTGRKPTALTVKGSEEWKEWIEEAASHCRISVSSLVDLAVTQYVKNQGFTKKPPER